VTEFITFEFRLFEVWEDFVYLQPLSQAMVAAVANDDWCTLGESGSMLLEDAYDGMSLAEFRTVIEQTDVDPEVIRQTNLAVDNFLRRRVDEAEDLGALSYYHYLANCAAYDISDLGGGGGEENEREDL
jgi:hypothetical protein